MLLTYVGYLAVWFGDIFVSSIDPAKVRGYSAARKAKKIGSADPGIRARAPVPAGPAGNWRETAPDWRTIPRFGGKSSTQTQLSHRFAFGGMKPAEFRGSTACRSICGANTAQLVRRYILTDLDVHRFDVVA